jgi:hypothetical protein
MIKLRPGAWVAAGGGKWAAPWLVAVNLQARMLHAPFVRSFQGFGRRWKHLEPLLEDVHVRELALGSGYIVTGQAPRPRPSRGPGPGRAGSRAGMHTCWISWTHGVWPPALQSVKLRVSS